VNEDAREGVKLYRMAAEAGVLAAKEELGDAYLYGLGVPINKIEAKKWYRAAQDQGDNSLELAEKIGSINTESDCCNVM
jgi:uncharacterized protein